MVRRATEVARPILFSTLIIITDYLPLFAFEHIEQKMFTPMAYTVGYALLGALAVALLLTVLSVCSIRSAMRRVSCRSSP